MLWLKSVKTRLNVLNATVIDKLINNKGSKVHVIIVWWYVSNNIGLCHQLIRPVFKGCLYGNNTKSSGFQITLGIEISVARRDDGKYVAKYHMGTNF